MVKYLICAVGAGFLLFAASYFAGLVSGWIPFHVLDLIPIVAGGVIGYKVVALLAQRNLRKQAEAERNAGLQ
ncbi:hypothetical protein ACYOEI_11510 [Singulisphaera rosea]